MAIAPQARSNWNKAEYKNDKDEMALSRHYSLFRGIVNKPPIHEGFTVTFAVQPSFHSLDKCEDKWHHQFNVQIDIQNIILPRVK